MKRRVVLGLLLAFLAPVVHAVGASKTLDVYDFSKGADTYHATATLPDGFVQDSLNMCFDCTAPASKRTGFTVAWSTKAYQYTGLWTYTDSTSATWQIARSSDQLTASNLGGTVVKVSTVSSVDNVGAVTAFGFIYFVDPTQGVYYWNGTSTTYVSASPKGSLITQFHQRLWVTGGTGANINQLYGSKYYDGATWTTGINATDPVQYSIGLNDNFDNVTAEYVYLDTLYLFKHYSIFGLTGFDQTNFQTSQLTQECGCIDQNTIQTYNGGLKFMSLRGVENFNGYTCQRISDNVKNKVDAATQNSFSAQSWTQTSQTDFQSGTSSPTVPVQPLSYTISPGDVVPGSFSVTENTIASGWGSGTANSVTVADGSLSLTLNDSGNVENQSFETLSAGLTIDRWTSSASRTTGSGSLTGSPFSCGNINVFDGSFMSLINCGLYTNCLPLEFRAIDASGNTVQAVSVTIDQTCTWVQNTLTPSAANKGKRVKFRIHEGGSDDLTTTSSYIWGGPISFYVASGVQYPNTYLAFDDVLLGSSTISSGTFTSQAYNTNVPYGKAIPSVAWTVGGTTPSFIVQQASSASGAWTDLSTSTGSNITFTKQYLRYLSTFTATSTDAQSQITSVGIVAQSSGVYYSAIRNIPSIASWGPLTVTDNTSGSSALTYFLRSSTNSFSALSSTPAWVLQSKNGIITASTGTGSGIYAQTATSFTIVNATDTLSLSLFTLNWFSGAKLPPMASTVFDNRYWLSLTTTTSDTSNDAVLVLNSQGRWSIYDIHAGAFTQTANSLYHADSLASGKVYLDNQGFSDNGSAMNAFIKTKDFSMGDLGRDHYFYSAYLSADNLGACDITTQYTPDKSTSTYSLGTVTQSEFATRASVRLPFPVDTTHQDFGRSVNLTIGSNDSQCGLNLYGIRAIYKDRPNN